MLPLMLVIWLKFSDDEVVGDYGDESLLISVKIWCFDVGDSAVAGDW